ncbi:hypothetical protein ASF16_22370 [Acidovorax sp. Leaf78]|nr:hypothetical protein ASF16_22370 [Acidovorax sp. Leaf78]
MHLVQGQIHTVAQFALARAIDDSRHFSYGIQAQIKTLRTLPAVQIKELEQTDLCQSKQVMNFQL